MSILEQSGFTKLFGNLPLYLFLKDSFGEERGLLDQGPIEPDLLALWWREDDESIDFSVVLTVLSQGIVWGSHSLH